MALLRIIDDSVDDPILRITRRERRRGDRGKLSEWNVACWIAQRSLLVPNMRNHEMRPVVSGCAGDDAIEIVRKSLRFH